MTDYIYQFIRCVSILMTAIMPYMKYILFLFTIIGFLWVNRIFVTNPALRPLLIESFQDESKRVSGKSLSAFACVASLLLAFFITILYDKNHQPPEYMVWVLAGLITSFYGIKEVGKVMGAKFSSPFSSPVTNNAELISVTQTTNNVVAEDEKVKEEKSKDKPKEEPIV